MCTLIWLYGSNVVGSHHFECLEIAMPALFSSFVWHLAEMRFVQIDRLERDFATRMACFVTALIRMML